MNDINEVKLSGIAAQDVTIGYTKNGQPWTTLPIKVNREKSFGGKTWMSTTWVKLKMFGAPAEAIGNARENDKIMVEGHLDTESWDDRHNPGKKIYRLVVMVSQAQMLSVPQDNIPATPPATPDPYSEPSDDLAGF